MKTVDLAGQKFNTDIGVLVVSVFLVATSSHSVALPIDPEPYIQENGHDFTRLGDDGKTRVYSLTERGSASRISALEKDIAGLPKNAEILRSCDFMRGGVKVKLIEESGIAFDVAVANYGYKGSTIACVLKYMRENKVGTQLIFSKKGQGGAYFVIITDGAPPANTLEDGAAAYRRRDYAAALRIFRPLAAQGDAQAQFIFGAMYGDGHGVKQDYSEKAKWCRLAAAQGLAIAQSDLGVMYERGQGVARNYTEALKWYRLAAEQGISIAQYNLGLMYYKGQGLTQDYAESHKWFQKAAAQGYVDAQADLGVMYDAGKGVAKDNSEAFKWYRLAADQGNSKAQYNVGIAYETGQGVTQDLDESLKWFKRAAEQGHAQAQSNLGVRFAKGSGVTRDYAQAAKWFGWPQFKGTRWRKAISA